MTREELFALIDIEDPSELEYFEQLADLMETEEKIEFDDLFTAISQVSAMTMGEFAENYFDEMLKALPDNAEDINSVISSIQQRFTMLSEDLDVGGSHEALAEEIERFRAWYHDPSFAEIDGKPVSVFAAIVECRADKLQNLEHEYEFANALDYPLEELTMNLGAFRKIDVVE